MASLPLTTSLRLNFRSVPKQSPLLNLHSTAGRPNDLQRSFSLQNPTFSPLKLVKTPRNEFISIKASAAASPISVPAKPDPPKSPTAGAAIAPLLASIATGIARGFIKIGLGNRIAYQFVSLSLFGSSSLGLGYSLVFSEALLTPAIPSVFARAGGIFLPLVKSLCVACGSNVGYGTEHKLGSWLMLTCFQTYVISSAMFLTAMAANSLSDGALGDRRCSSVLRMLQWPGE